jgi:hypothetical protein
MPDGPAIVLDFVLPTQIIRTSRVAKALALALLVIASHLEARADQVPAMTRPLSTAEALTCCRICWKVQPCGDSCIRAAGVRVLGRQRVIIHGSLLLASG